MRLAGAMIAALLMAASPAAAEQVRITGETTADDRLIGDVLRTIQQFAGAQGCTTLSSVEMRILPSTYRPSDPNYHVGEGTVAYEQWTASMCDRTTDFLISYWAAPDGGTNFNVGHPLPADVPPAPEPSSS